ncbi:MAG: glycosyltransferase [Planctomycetota bacterium]|nr:glycosyltransferase [Planctomycetota bacterium]
MQAEGAIQLTLVIPVYNGARFIASSLQQAHDWLVSQRYRTELLVVDDGSSDETAAILAAFAAAESSGHCRLTFLRNVSNQGKGFSVRRAFLHAGGELVIFTDADLTYPVSNCEPLIEALVAGADVAYGSRMHSDSRYVVAPNFFGKLFTRHFMGRMFNLLLRMIVVQGVMDSQAGLKGCRRATAQKLATRVQLARFSFDVELFFVAARLGLSVVECPVQFIYRKEPTTVHFVRDSITMVCDMLRVRWRGFRGVYEREPDPAMVSFLRMGGDVEPVAAKSVQSREPNSRSKSG